MKKLLICTSLLGLTLLFLAGTAAANLIQTGGFETPLVGDSGHPNWKWAVYENVGSWRLLSGQGIEIQTSGTVKDSSGSYVNAHGDNQYIELDSDKKRHVDYVSEPGASAPTNSAMGQDIQLTVGTYELSFWYRPRTDLDNDNGISFGLWDTDSLSILNSFGIADGKNSVVTDWTQYTHRFSITTDGSYTLAFAAVGLSNYRGGFLDDVQLNAVPIPGALWLLGSGLLGLVGVRRRRKI